MAYTPVIVSPDTYKSDVRTKLGLDVVTLPDDAISDDLHCQPAENWVIRCVPDYATLAGVDRAHLYAATIARIAAERCDGLENIVAVQERSEWMEVRRMQIDWQAKKRALLAEASEHISLISTQTQTTYCPLVISKTAR